MLGWLYHQIDHVYHKGRIYSDAPEDKPFYEQQLREAITSLQSGHYDLLIISGGYTSWDSLHRKSLFARKRQKRDPWSKGNPYSEINEFKNMFSMLDLMEEKGITDHRLVDFPWTSTKSESQRGRTINQEGDRWSIVYEQHWLHARHVENERLWFTNVITIVVVALLSGLLTLWGRISSTIASAIACLIIGFGVIGCLMMITWRIPFLDYTTLAIKMLRDDGELKKYIPYEAPEFERKFVELEIRGTRLRFLTTHFLFCLFFAVLSAMGSFIFAYMLEGAFCCLQILIATIVFVILMIGWAWYEKAYQSSRW